MGRPADARLRVSPLSASLAGRAVRPAGAVDQPGYLAEWGVPYLIGRLYFADREALGGSRSRRRRRPPRSSRPASTRWSLGPDWSSALALRDPVRHRWCRLGGWRPEACLTTASSWPTGWRWRRSWPPGSGPAASGWRPPDPRLAARPGACWRRRSPAGASTATSILALGLAAIAATRLTRIRAGPGRPCCWSRRPTSGRGSPALWDGGSWPSCAARGRPLGGLGGHPDLARRTSSSAVVRIADLAFGRGRGNATVGRRLVDPSLARWRPGRRRGPLRGVPPARCPVICRRRTPPLGLRRDGPGALRHPPHDRQPAQHAR